MVQTVSLYDAVSHIRFLKLSYLERALRVDSPQAVQAALTYASYLNEIGINAENYPLFLEVMHTNNKWVIDALTEGADLDTFLDPVIPTYHIVGQIFRLFTGLKRGQLNRKVIQIFLGYLKKVYREPHSGYEVYTLSIPDLNNMSKNLNEDQSDEDPVNSLILDILRNINEMNELSAYKNLGERAEIASQAGKIRSNFFDTKRQLKYALSAVLLEQGKEETESARNMCTRIRGAMNG